MNKKILIAFIVALAVILAAAFSIFKYSMQGSRSNLQNSVGGAATEQKIEPATTDKNNTQPQAPSSQPEGTGKKGSLTVCLDKCGDGICQKSDPNCTDGSLNCICPETPENCPQDCK